MSGKLAKILDANANAYIQKTILKRIGNSLSFIGVERKHGNRWTYSDGTPLIYQNWDKNEPNTSKNSTRCAMMSAKTGKWHAADCLASRPYVCSVDEDEIQCPDDWFYFKTTNYCYYLKNFTHSDGARWRLYNFATAEKDCQRMGAHLASIHSKAENDFVFDLVTSNVKSLSNVAPEYDNNPCYYQSAWIGYYGNGTLGTGIWTDVSEVDYVESSSPEPFNWVTSNDKSCDRRWWGWTVPEMGFARYVCKMASESRKDK
ncbi:unnamed protein product, partial [Mesorhabditis belari]|uniref:C-type lectin domain-containing protein n=1 Tax=Mesorhabditis belari TaxID=2138241 RepID=A0AAF3FID1_9BILA